MEAKRRQSSTGKRASSGSGIARESFGLDAKLLDHQAAKLISSYIDSARSEDVESCWLELQGLPLYDQALSSSAGVPASVARRVKLAVFCREIFGSEAERKLVAASQRFEGNDIVPEEFERHNGYWDLALALRTQALVAAAKEAESNRSGSTDVDAVCPIPSEDSNSNSESVDIVRRHKFTEDVTARRDEFKASKDWIALRKKYDWTTFVRDMKGYVRQINEHYPVSLLADSADSQGAGRWSPDDQSAKPASAAPPPAPATKKSQAANPTGRTVSTKTATQQSSLASKVDSQMSVRIVEDTAGSADPDPLDEEAKERARKKREREEFLALLREMKPNASQKKESQSAARAAPAPVAKPSAPATKPGAPAARRPLEIAPTRNNSQSRHERSPSVDLGNASSPNRAVSPAPAPVPERPNQNKRSGKRLYFEGSDSEGERVRWDSDEEDQPPSPRKKAKKEERSPHRPENFQLSRPVKIEDVGSLRSEAKDDDISDDDMPKVVKGKRARKNWTREELQALETGLQKFGTSWTKIMDLYGPEGSISNVLGNRSQVDLKDKARNERHKREKSNIPLGVFELVKGYN